MAAERFTLTAPTATTGQFFIVSPTNVVTITTTAGDPNPVFWFILETARLPADLTN